MQRQEEMKEQYRVKRPLSDTEINELFCIDFINNTVNCFWESSVVPKEIVIFGHKSFLCGK